MIRGADGGPVNPYTVERYSVIEAFTSPRPYLLRRSAKASSNLDFLNVAKLLLYPITLKEARHFVRRHHRHHDMPQGGLFALSCCFEGDEQPRGVVIVGRPVSRRLDDGLTVEVTRCCTDGTRNACSFLYGAARKAAFSLGYRKIVTYTLRDESGASLRAAAFHCDGEAGGGNWNVPSRPRVDTDLQQSKIRWSDTA